MVCFSGSITNREKAAIITPLVFGALALAVAAVAIPAIFLAPVAFTAIATISAIAAGATLLLATIAFVVALHFCSARHEFAGPKTVVPFNSSPLTQALSSCSISLGTCQIDLVFNNREQGFAQGLRDLLLSSSITKCPYTHICIQSTMTGRPQLAFDDDGLFQEFSSGLPDTWDPAKVLFLYLPLDAAKTQQLEKADWTDPVERKRHHNVSVKFIPSPEWHQGKLSEKTILDLFGEEF